MTTSDAPARLFRGGGSFQADLTRAVRDILDEKALRRGRMRFFSKAAFMLLWTAASYAYLVFMAGNWWQAGLGCISLALALGGVAFSIQHDANHGAVGRRWRFLGLSLDILLGTSSYLWRERHNHAHHTYTNVVDKDGDIEQMPLARFAPDQPRRPWHRFQHIYMFALYGFYAPRQTLMGDASMLLRGPNAHVPLRRPRGGDLWELIVTKVIFVGLFLVLPMFMQPWWGVLLGAFVTLWILGIILAVVFQLAHCVEEADFTSEARMAAESERDGPREWARHQVEHTVDFARSSRVLNWYLGGLNFQVEHHLLPNVCHVHYRHISPVLEQLCLEHDLHYRANDTFLAALRSHARWLRAMGQAPYGPIPSDGAAKLAGDTAPA